MLFYDSVMSNKALEAPWIRSVLGNISPKVLLVARFYHKDVLHASPTPNPLEEIARIKSEEYAAEELGMSGIRALRHAHTHPHTY